MGLAGARATVRLYFQEKHCDANLDVSDTRKTQASKASRTKRRWTVCAWPPIEQAYSTRRE